MHVQAAAQAWLRTVPGEVTQDEGAYPKNPITGTRGFLLSQSLSKDGSLQQQQCVQQVAQRWLAIWACACSHSRNPCGPALTAAVSASLQVRERPFEHVMQHNATSVMIADAARTTSPRPFGCRVLRVPWPSLPCGSLQARTHICNTSGS
jgi:hypothetical protein